MDKWLKLDVHAIQLLLGLSWNTRELAVGITPEFRAEVVHLLNTTWHDNRASFDIKYLKRLVGRLGRCGQGFFPIFHKMPPLCASGAFALKENDEFLYSTHKGYRTLIRKVKCEPKYEDDTQEICFAIG